MPISTASSPADSHPISGSMTKTKPVSAVGRVTPAGLMFLAITSVGWGFNWPVTKYLLGELPPLTLRGGTGVIERAASGGAGDCARGEPEGRSRAVAAAYACGAAQRHRLDGA